MRSFLVLPFLLITFFATAQNAKPGDSVLHKVDSANNVNRTKKIGEKNGLNVKMKSMSPVDSLFLFHPELSSVDSLKLAYQVKAKEIKSKTGRKQKQIKHSLDSLERKFKMQSDVATKRFMAKKKNLVAGHEKEIASKANLNTPAVSSLFPNINSNSLSSANVPGIPLPNASITNLSLPNSDLTIPDTSIPNTGIPNTNLPNTSIPDASLNKEIQNDTKEIGTLEKEAGGYEKQLEQIKKDSMANAQKLEKMIEDQAQGRREVKALRDKELEKEKMLKLQQQYLDKVAQYKNPKKAEEEIKQNLANVANADLLKNEKPVQSAQLEMAKAKKKYGEFQSIKNLPKRPVNPMKQLPLRERIYPGVMFQTANGKFFSLDIAPQAYYKITTRFDAGVGFVYRFNYDFKKSCPVGANDLYGFKAFTNFKIYKKFYFRLEGERVLRQQPLTTNPDFTFSRWTNTLLAGIGKEILISKKIQGNTQVLYNTLDHYDSPYASKVLFRVGFNLSLKKDQRKEFIKSLN